MCVDLGFGGLSLAAYPRVGVSSSVGKESFLSPFSELYLHASNAMAGGSEALSDSGEEQKNPAVDWVVFSYICRGLFVILGCNILLY